MNSITISPNEINLIIFILDQHIDHLIHVQEHNGLDSWGMDIDGVRELREKMFLLKDDSTIL